MVLDIKYYLFFKKKWKKKLNKKKLWPASFILSRWILDYSDIFKEKEILEVGSGPGLTGWTLTKLAKKVTLTDYLEVVKKRRN